MIYYVLLPIIKLGHLSKILGYVIYIKTKQEKLLGICMKVKRFSNNKLSSFFKAISLNCIIKSFNLIIINFV